MGVYKTKDKTKDGRIYYFRVPYKDVFGVRHVYSSPKYKTRREALEEEVKYKSKVHDMVLTSSTVTLNQAFKDFLDKEKFKVKKQTLTRDINLFKHLEPIQDKKVNQITLPIYQKYKEYLDKEPLSNDYKNKILGILRRTIIHSSKYYGTSDSILKYIENYKNVNQFKKDMDFYTIEEFKHFIMNVDVFEWQVFFSMLYYLGLRQGELQALTWSDISFQKKEVSITKTLTSKIKGENYTISTPKTKNSIRVLPLSKNLCTSLKTMKLSAMKYKNFKESWFVFGNTIPYKESTIQKYKNKYCDLASLRRIRIHDFRHSCASMLINQGASISLVSKYLGHSKTSITLDIYTHFYKNELETITERINQL